MITTRVVAHRGDSWSAPENTIPAFRAAITLGVDAVELDARVTVDGVPVVLHDETLSRLWGVPRRVAGMTAAEVAAVRRAGVGIPTLAQALDEFVEAGIDVVVDLPSAARVERIIETVRAHPVAGRVIWSGIEEALSEVRAAEPDAVIYSHHADSALRPTMINMDFTTIVEAEIRAVHERGLGLSIWTVDDPETMSWLVRRGVESITTNRPDLLLKVRDQAPMPELDAEATRWLGVGVAITRRAMQLQRSASDFTIDIKQNNPADLVTEVDRAVERMVREVIAAELPEHVVVGEEYGGEPGSEFTWYCDPVDGTTNFANGLRWSSFSLSLVRDDRIVLGVVGDTITDEVSYAVAGWGAVAAGLPIRTRPATLPGGVLLTEPAGADLAPGQAEFFTRIASVGATARVLGSGTLALALPAAGRGVAGLIHRFHPIDHAASVRIALEAGCDLLDTTGAQLEPLVSELLGRSVIVAAPGIADELRPLLAW